MRESVMVWTSTHKKLLYWGTGLVVLVFVVWWLHKKYWCPPSVSGGASASSDHKKNRMSKFYELFGISKPASSMDVKQR